MGIKISVIIPTYNRQRSLMRAIQSVLQQTCKDFELLVVDDGSTDDTQNLLSKITDSRVRIFRTENRGVSAARNLAIKEAEGEWVAFLDSDDEWLPQKLERQIELLQKDSSLRWVHGEEIWIRNGSRVNPMQKHKKSGGDIFINSLKLCCVSPSAVVLQKSLFAEVGYFREDFPVCEDYDLWIKLAERHPVGFVEEPLVVKYGGHEDQLSRKFFAMDYWRVLSMSQRIDAGLTPDKEKQVAEEVLAKSQVLLKGYRKHGNLQNFDFVFSQMKKAEKILCLPLD